MKRTGLKRANERIRALGRLYQRAEAPLAKIAKASTCSPACHGCCRQLIYASTAEGEFIVRTHWRAVRAALPALRAQAAALGELAAELPPTQAEREELAARYYRLFRACAFLEDGRCTIYAARPMACRAYFVASDPELCGRRERTTIAIVGNAFYHHGASMIAEAIDSEILEVDDLASVVLHVIGEGER